MRAKYLFALVVALICAASTVQAVEIFYPADKTYVTRPDYLIVQGGSSDVTAMTIAINGVESERIDISSDAYRAAFGDLLIVEPLWDPGENRILVKAYKEQQLAGKAEATIFYMNSPSAYPPQGYEPFVMHTADREAECATCHNMNPSEAEYQADTEETSTCGSCHKRMLNREYAHGPAAMYACGTCHVRDSAPNKYRLVKEEPALCNDCHADKTEEFRENKYVHGPVGAGMCTVCHDPHASDYNAQLYGFPNDVCMACHEQLDLTVHAARGVGGNPHPLRGDSDPLDPESPFSCVSCHDPHGSMGPYMFINDISSRMQLCQECHKK